RPLAISILNLGLRQFWGAAPNLFVPIDGRPEAFRTTGGIAESCWLNFVGKATACGCFHVTCSVVLLIDQKHIPRQTSDMRVLHVINFSSVPKLIAVFYRLVLIIASRTVLRNSTTSLPLNISNCPVSSGCTRSKPTSYP